MVALSIVFTFVLAVAVGAVVYIIVDEIDKLQKRVLELETLQNKKRFG